MIIHWSSLTVAITSKQIRVGCMTKTVGEWYKMSKSELAELGKTYHIDLALLFVVMDLSKKPDLLKSGHTSSE